MSLRNLSVTTGVLLVIAIFVHYSQSMRGTDLVTGSDFIKGIEINKINKIKLSFQGNKELILTKDMNRFVIENHKSYPADTAKINDLIYKIASIQVKEKVSSDVDEDELAKYELGDKRKYEVKLYDNEGKNTINFKVGKNQRGKGNYIYKEGSEEIYLSDSLIWLNSSHKDFINLILLDLKKDEIDKVSLSNKMIKEEKLEEYKNKIKNLRFQEYYTPNDTQVTSLNWSKELNVQMKNKLIYNVKLAKKKDDYFLKLLAKIDEMPNKVTISQKDGEEKLKSIDNMVKAQVEAQKVNSQVSRWIYKIDKETFDKITKI
jgi:hypothetical protein